MKVEGPALRRHATRIACATALFLACAVLCSPGWAVTTKHSKKKGPTASSTKGTTKNISTKGKANKGTTTASTTTPKKPVASAKTSTRGKSRRASATSRRSSRREK